LPDHAAHALVSAAGTVAADDDQRVHRPGESAAWRDRLRLLRRGRRPASRHELTFHHGRIEDESRPFKGGAPAVVALMSGEIQAIITPIPEIISHIKSGRVRAIAVSSAKRTTQFPDIPSIGETVKGYDYSSWFGAFAPAGMPRPIIDRLNAEIRKAMADPAVAANLASQTLDPMPMSPEEFARLRSPTTTCSGRSLRLRTRASSRNDVTWRTEWQNPCGSRWAE
jgi:hypothetical protein